MGNPEVISAGGLVVRSTPSPAALLVTHAGEPTAWRIPKGMQEGAETLEECAIREVLEETGHLALVETFVTTASWTYEYEGTLWDETCHFYLMSLASTETQEHDSEVAETAWLPLEEVPGQLAYEEEREAARAAIERRKTRPSYELNADVLADLTSVAAGISGGRSVTAGQLAISEPALDELTRAGRPAILVRQTLHPRYVPLLLKCTGIVATNGGMTSHLAVVARQYGRAVISGIPSLEILDRAIRIGTTVIPERAWVTLDEARGQILLGRIGHGSRMSSPSQERGGAQSERRRAASTAATLTEAGKNQEAIAVARKWAQDVADHRRLGEVRVWKFFKRDLVGCWFPPPEHQRFGPDWSVDDALAYARTLRPRLVRYSLFPDSIACHAESHLLPPDVSEDVWRLELNAADRACSIEIFPQQPLSAVCWRAVVSGDAVNLEASIGQAMQAFETERGSHPIVTAHLDATEQEVDSVPEGVAADGLLAQVQELLDEHGVTLWTTLSAMISELEIDTLAVEGYFYVDDRSLVVVDMDLPFDAAFMTLP